VDVVEWLSPLTLGQPFGLPRSLFYSSSSILLIHSKFKEHFLISKRNIRPVYLYVGHGIMWVLRKGVKPLESWSLKLEARWLNIEPSILQNYSSSLVFIDEFFDWTLLIVVSSEFVIFWQRKSSKFYEFLSIYRLNMHIT
jgi:hypothetical protein